MKAGLGFGLGSGLGAALGSTLAPRLVHAQAQDYPSRVVNFVNGFPPGAPTDNLARALGPMMEKQLGQPFVIINRPGAGGIVAMQHVATAEPDGYTVMLSGSGIATIGAVNDKLPFDIRSDFRRVGRAVTSQLLLAVRTGLPVNNLKELIALAKAKPGALNYGSTGVGTPPHLCALAFMQEFGLQMTEVQYRGGAPALADVLGGHLDLVFAGPSSLAGPAKAGKLRLLVTVGERRSSLLPDYPTFQELGFDTPELRAGAWWGLIAPAKTPDAIVTRLNGALVKALNIPANQEALDKLSFVASPTSPQGFDEFVDGQTRFWSKLLNDPRFKKKAS